MRCMACGAEMTLMHVVEDDTMAAPGFEHHTFMCSECHDIERRLVFTKHGREDDLVPVPAHVAPPIAGEQSNHEPMPLVDMAPSISPTSAAVLEEHPVIQGLLRRVVAKLRGR